MAVVQQLLAFEVGRGDRPVAGHDDVTRGWIADRAAGGQVAPQRHVADVNGFVAALDRDAIGLLLVVGQLAEGVGVFPEGVDQRRGGGGLRR